MAEPFPVAITVSEPGWEVLAGDDVEGLVGRAVRAAVSVLEDVPSGELSVALVSDAEIARLNAAYRDKAGATNVLSFPGTDPAGLSQGDVVVALQTVLREAGKRGRPARDHATHLLIHGFLHLQGYDHQTKSERATMEALEIRAMDSLGLANPYVLPA